MSSATWISVDELVARVEREADRPPYRYAALLGLDAVTFEVAQPPPWTPPAGKRQPWAGLRDRQVAEDAARLVAREGLRQGCRLLGIDARTAGIAWARHGIPRPVLPRGRKEGS